MNVDFIIGDLHFGNDGMFNRAYSKTFSTKEEYMESVVKNYNQVISNNHRVVFLGDLGNGEELKKYIPKMKGYKILILGNHDKYAKRFYNDLFDEVYSTPIFILPRIVLSHEPIPVEPGVLNLHGHTHAVKLKSDQHINLCIEHTDYKPVRFKQFTGILSNMEKPNRKFLKEWYKDIQIWTGDDREDLVLNEDGLIDVEETIKLGKVRGI